MLARPIVARMLSRWPSVAGSAHWSDGARKSDTSQSETQPFKRWQTKQRAGMRCATNAEMTNDVSRSDFASVFGNSAGHFAHVSRFLLCSFAFCIQLSLHCA